MYQRGVIHHLFPLIVVALALLVGAYLLLQGKIPSLPSFTKQPKVELQEKYQNPFKKETQFVNPFETYKNPFVTNR